MNTENYCNDHTDHKSRLKRNESDIQLLWKEINGMKKWVISGMTGLLVQVVVFVFAIILMVLGKI